MYDMSIIINSGQASTIAQRAQFNCQISIVIPTGESFQIMEEYMPLINNQNYTSTTPTNWGVISAIASPSSQPENDFYAIAPALSPTSFYNDLETGDIVKLFSFKVGSSNMYDPSVRFYENGEDPSDQDGGMNGSDFSNGFTMGGPVQIYNGNQEEDCFTITSTDDSFVKEQSFKAYPNPFHSSIQIKSEVNSIINIIDQLGKTVKTVSIPEAQITSIHLDELPNGIYFIERRFEGLRDFLKVIKTN